MDTTKRFQIFISSTYEDLREERQEATQAILEMGHFPSGMELFPASDLSQWQLIQRVISECDYYLVIAAGRYGNIGPNGSSYTEMEYDFAVASNIPVLGFVKKDLGAISAKFSEQGTEGRAKLLSFREKIMSRTCRMFDTASELGMAVMKSLTNEIRVNPQEGWVPAQQAKSFADYEHEKDLRDALNALQEENEQLKREKRDRSLDLEGYRPEDLAQAADRYTLNVAFTNRSKQYSIVPVAPTWDQVFSAIGPSMYGYIVRKATGYPNSGKYPFHESLEHLIRSYVFEEAQSRKIEISDSDVDTIVIHLKQLGYLKFSEKDKGEQVFRGITLTDIGEQRLTQLKVQLSSPAT